MIVRVVRNASRTTMGDDGALVIEGDQSSYILEYQMRGRHLQNCCSHLCLRLPPIALLTLLGFFLAVIHPFWLVLNVNFFRTELAQCASSKLLRTFAFMWSEIDTLPLGCKEMCKEMYPGAIFQPL